MRSAKETPTATTTVAALLCVAATGISKPSGNIHGDEPVAVLVALDLINLSAIQSDPLLGAPDCVQVDATPLMVLRSDMQLIDHSFRNYMLLDELVLMEGITRLLRGLSSTTSQARWLNHISELISCNPTPASGSR